mmetsp:Transcript_20868/g.28785  ORF Transcript_20868/g.28785 Transcript_20868/m.28785 type:complete len:501 (+) Transcript_20868:64-1566(+)
MEAVLDTISSEGNVLEALKKFNGDFKEKSNFSDIAEDLKQKFVAVISDLALDDKTEETIRELALTSLRYTFRDRSGSASIIPYEKIFRLLQIASLVPPDSKIPENLDSIVEEILTRSGTFKYPQPSDESGIEDEELDRAKKEDTQKANEYAQKLPPLDGLVKELGDPWVSPYKPTLQAEAAKCIVNIITRHERTEAIVEAFNVLPCLLLHLKHQSFPKDSRFPFLRLLLRMTFERVLKFRLFSSSVLNILADLLDRSLEDIDHPIYTHDIEECLKVIFSVSIPLGPLEGPTLPTEEQYQGFKQMIKAFQILLFLPKEPRYRRLKSAAVSALINVPARCTDLFEPERTLDALIDVLHFQVDIAVADESRAAEVLTPILLNLTAIAKAIPRARPILRAAVFPKEVFEADSQATIQAHEILEKGDSLASKLMEFMTSFNVAVKHYANNFFYVILDEDANELVRLAGFGRAAGLLATLKLFGMDKMAEAQLGGRPRGPPSGPSS